MKIVNIFAMMTMTMTMVVHLHWQHSRKKAGSRDPGSRTFFGPN